ncbi:hypothetical protein F4782DRAFT_501613 [Xylaria castorea]|nr:hypothetical protein F4782DRAFT_501613 [Xylaria castorea]
MTMSSTTGLSRTRSIRRPAANEDGSSHNKPVHGRNEARNVSPSRLPMRPPSTTTTTTSRARAPTGLASRLVSGGSSTKTSSRSVGNTNGAPAAVKPLTRRQTPSTTTTSSAAVSRLASTVARPRSSASVSSTTAPKERHMGHARAKSTVTSLTAATTLRPLSHAPSRSNPSPAPSTASSTSTTTQTASISSSRVQTRSQTQHARVSSQSKPQSQIHSSAAPSTLATRRPAFNTNQKHYSPAKSLAPKPLTSTFLAPPSPSKQPVNVALTAETSRLQTELLQLSLLHREAHGVSASWHASARSKLGARFGELAAADRALRAAERDGAEARGLRDLLRWADAGPEKENGGTAGGDKKRNNRARERLPLEEKIQLLDQILNGAWALGEPGGRYQRTVRAFEDWALRVAEIRAAQRGGDIDGLLARGGGGGGGFGIGDGEEELAVFVSDLDASTWKRDHAGLVRILEGWRRTLAQLGHVESDQPGNVENGRNKGTSGGDTEGGGGDKSLSGLARTLRGCRSLVRDMLAELKVMEQIEQDALAAEEGWMEQMEARLRAEEKDTSRRRKKEDAPPWKLLVL